MHYLKVCYSFKCPCCHNSFCDISEEEKVFLKENYNIYCPARDNNGVFNLDFDKNPLFEVFKQFHESLYVLRKLRK